ncbi:MAG: LysE family transporter [Bacteroidetes bacterium]|nr:LysE family transporter [Bacteroidota bacterium]
MLAALVKGLALGLMLSISVGPVIFSIIKQSLNNGHKGGYFFVAGVSSSDITLVILCNFFTSLFHSAMDHEMIIGSIGSLFLISLGVYNIFYKKVEVNIEGSAQIKTFRKRDLLGIYLSGFFMNFLNPGVFLFWIAASATILADSKTEIHDIQYRIIVFATCLIFVLLADISKVLLANKIRARLTPHNIHIINRISGMILIGFGIALIIGIAIRSNVFVSAHL